MNNAAVAASHVSPEDAHGRVWRRVRFDRQQMLLGTATIYAPRLGQARGSRPGSTCAVGPLCRAVDSGGPLHRPFDVANAARVVASSSAFPQKSLLNIRLSPASRPPGRRGGFSSPYTEVCRG